MASKNGDWQASKSVHVDSVPKANAALAKELARKKAQKAKKNARKKQRKGKK